MCSECDRPGADVVFVIGCEVRYPLHLHNSQRNWGAAYTECHREQSGLITTDLMMARFPQLKGESVGPRPRKRKKLLLWQRRRRRSRLFGSPGLWMISKFRAFTTGNIHLFYIFYITVIHFCMSDVFFCDVISLKCKFFFFWVSFFAFEPKNVNCTGYIQLSVQTVFVRMV